MAMNRAKKAAKKQLKKWEKLETKYQRLLKKASAQADRWKKKADRAK